MPTEGNNQYANSDQVEALRAILEDQQCRPVSIEEAREVGESLITFYEVLAEDVDDLLADGLQMQQKA